MKTMKDSQIDLIGLIPEEWHVSRIKNILENASNGIWGEEPKNDENDIACIRVTNFNRKENKISLVNLTTRNLEKSKQKKYLLQKNDILIEKSGGGEKQPVGFTCLYPYDVPAIYANFLMRVRANQKVCNPLFLNYFFISLYNNGINNKYFTQTTGIQNLDSTGYFQEKIPLPTLSEQQRIANFLDHKTAQMDSLITSKEKQVSLLNEYKQSLISETVTKGLNPNVPTKESRVEWIGAIPENWKNMKFDYAIERVTTGLNPRDNFTLGSGENYYVTIRNFKNRKLYLDENCDKIDNNALAVINARSNLLAGDVLFASISQEPQIYRIKEQPTNWNINESVFSIRAKKEILMPDFMEYLLSSSYFYNELKGRATGATFKSVKIEHLKTNYAVIPPTEEQQQIVKFLDHKTAQLDSIINQVQTEIEKLKEYKQSLIFEAVTGKIEI